MWTAVRPAGLRAWASDCPVDQSRGSHVDREAFLETHEQHFLGPHGCLWNRFRALDSFISRDEEFLRNVDWSVTPQRRLRFGRLLQPGPLD